MQYLTINASLLTPQRDIITTHETFYPLKCKLEATNTPQQKSQKIFSYYKLAVYHKRHINYTLDLASY